MTSVPATSLIADIVDEYAVLSVDDLSRLCAVDRSHIIELVEEGVLTVQITADEWHFSGTALRRARTAMRLQHDLDINLPGVALALQLMEELDQLRRQIQVLR